MNAAGINIIGLVTDFGCLDQSGAPWLRRLCGMTYWLVQCAGSYATDFYDWKDKRIQARSKTCDALVYQ